MVWSFPEPWIRAAVGNARSNCRPPVEAKTAPRVPRPRSSRLRARNALPRSSQMSSGSSRPTESRTMSSPMPAWVNCSADIWRWVVLARWMTRVRTSPTLARCDASRQDSMNRRPASCPPSPRTTPWTPPRRGQPPGDLVVGMAGEVGVGDPSDRRMRPEELDHLGGHPLVAFHPGGEGLYALKHQPGDHRVHAGPEVAQPLGPARMANAAGPNSSANTTPYGS